MDNKDLKQMVVPPTQDFLQDIWVLQSELMKDYKEIEKWEVEYPLNMNLKKSQLLVKDVIARGIEELAEAYEAIEDGDEANFLEELGDALHFFVEILVLCNISPGNVKAFFHGYLKEEFTDSSVETYSKFVGLQLDRTFWTVTFRMNLARNALRNKPWKQTEMMYNKELFESELLIGFIEFLLAFTIKAGSVKKLYEIYYKKNQINRFRIRSKY